MLLEISGEITPEIMKGWSKNNTHLWMGLVIEARFDAIATWCEEDSLEKTLMLGRMREGGEGNDRG